MVVETEDPAEKMVHWLLLTEPVAPSVSGPERPSRARLIRALRMPSSGTPAGWEKRRVTVWVAPEWKMGPVEVTAGTTGVGTGVTRAVRVVEIATLGMKEARET